MAVNPLNRLAYFVAVVEAGSFTAAADRLGVSKAVVSQHVAALERDAQAALLVRTTRRVRTTEAGQAFYARCARILQEAETAFGELSESATEPSGVLRLTAPLDYGISVLVPAIASFSARYPQCEVEAQFSDRTLDLSTNDIDLAIRVGWVTTLHLQTRRVGRFEQRLVAAPQWQDRLASIDTPSGLAALPLVANLSMRDPARWTFTRGAGRRQTVTLPTVLRFDATLAVREAARAGAGLSVLPDYVVAQDLADGRLILALPGWALPPGEIHAVFPTTRFRPAKVRAFTQHLVDFLAPDGAA